MAGLESPMAMTPVPLKAIKTSSSMNSGGDWDEGNGGGGNDKRKSLVLKHPPETLGSKAWPAASPNKSSPSPVKVEEARRTRASQKENRRKKATS